jgi:hypothetical protein
VWSSEPVWTLWSTDFFFRFCRESNPSRPARSSSLYRWSYPRFCQTFTHFIGSHQPACFCFYVGIGFTVKVHSLTLPLTRNFGSHQSYQISTLALRASGPVEIKFLLLCIIYKLSRAECNVVLRCRPLDCCPEGHHWSIGMASPSGADSVPQIPWGMSLTSVSRGTSVDHTVSYSTVERSRNILATCMGTVSSLFSVRISRILVGREN